MLENIVGGLVLAAVGALFYLAYEHGSEFRKIQPNLLIGACAIWVGCAIWNFAIQASFRKTLKFVKLDEFDSATSAINSVTINPEIHLIAGLGAFFGLMLATWVSRLKDSGDESESTEGDDEK